MSITYRTGDLLNCDEQVIAHGCNTKGAFGAGVAGQIAKKWPQAKRAYQMALAERKFQLGSAQLVDVQGFTLSRKFLFNLGTQRNPGADATTWAIFLSFANMAETCYMQEFNSVAIPRIGCGIGGLRWSEVAPVIADACYRSSHPDLEIVVYDLPGR